MAPRFARDVECRAFFFKCWQDHGGRTIKGYRNRKPFDARCNWSKEVPFGWSDVLFLTTNHIDNDDNGHMLGVHMLSAFPSHSQAEKVINLTLPSQKGLFLSFKLAVHIYIYVIIYRY